MNKYKTQIAFLCGFLLAFLWFSYFYGVAYVGDVIRYVENFVEQYTGHTIGLTSFGLLIYIIRTFKVYFKDNAKATRDNLILENTITDLVRAKKVYEAIGDKTKAREIERQIEGLVK